VFEKLFPQFARPTLRYILQKAFFKHALTGLYFIENLDMEIELYDIINPRH